MSIALTTHQKNLLIELCASKGEVNLAIAHKVVEGNVQPGEIEILCNVLLDEYLMRGIDENFEPSQYGGELERLREALNR